MSITSAQTIVRALIFPLKNTGSRNDVKTGNVENVIVPIATVDN
jgi:hypothetical protein